MNTHIVPLFDATSVIPFSLQFAGEERKQIVKNRWKRLAHRRHQLVKKGNTLNANFRKKFVQLQEVMNEEMPDDVSIAQEERVSAL